MINVLDEINQRIGLGSILSLARKKMVPQHRHSIWYYMGGMLLFLLLIQLVTGPLLLFFYKPTAESAYQSVKEIMVNVPLWMADPFSPSLGKQYYDRGGFCAFLFNPDCKSLS